MLSFHLGQDDLPVPLPPMPVITVPASSGASDAAKTFFGALLFIVFGGAIGYAVGFERGVRR